MRKHKTCVVLRLFPNMSVALQSKNKHDYSLPGQVPPVPALRGIRPGRVLEKRVEVAPPSVCLSCALFPPRI